MDNEDRIAGQRDFDRFRIRYEPRNRLLFPIEPQGDIKEFVEVTPVAAANRERLRHPNLARHRVTWCGIVTPLVILGRKFTAGVVQIFVAQLLLAELKDLLGGITVNQRDFACGLYTQPHFPLLYRWGEHLNDERVRTKRGREKRKRNEKEIKKYLGTPAATIWIFSEYFRIVVGENVRVVAINVLRKPVQA